MRSLCRSPLIISIETRIANNSEPYIEASTEFCRFKNHMIGAQFTNIKIPECYFLVSLHPAWSAAGVFKASHNNVFAMWRRNISRMCFCRIGIESDQLHSTNLSPQNVGVASSMPKSTSGCVSKWPCPVESKSFRFLISAGGCKLNLDDSLTVCFPTLVINPTLPWGQPIRVLSPDLSHLLRVWSLFKSTSCLIGLVTYRNSKLLTSTPE